MKMTKKAFRRQMIVLVADLLLKGVFTTALFGLTMLTLLLLA